MPEEPTICAIEVGPDAFALAPRLSNKIFGSGPMDVLYVDHRFDAARRAKENTDRSREDIFGETKRQGRDLVVLANTETLPVASESTDVVLAANVFGADGYTRYKVGDWKKISSEWNRVLREGGKVAIIETSTPAPRDKVIKALVEAGFERDKITVYKNTEDIEELYDDPVEAKIFLELSNMESWAVVVEK